jgi:predicted TIM-barrel fold metal-dependent hydrolase
MQTIDFHVHVFPDRLSRFLPDAQAETVQMLRRKARDWMRPYSGALHRLQTAMRHVPAPLRKNLDAMSALAPLPGLMLESTPADLLEVMDAAGVDRAVVIAQPPYMPNEFVLGICQDNPRLIAAVNIPPGTPKPGVALRKMHEAGARILKIHGAADGEGADSPRYRALLKSGSELGMPVILHTGCIHSTLLFKSPEQGQAQRYSEWFGRYPRTPFILAHMNFHEPHVAMDLAEEHANVYVDTSWQPAEVIGEAVRRIGAERVLFGTDWPIVGQNLRVGLERIQDCVDSGIFSAADQALIRGGNAAKLLGLGDAAGA